MSSDTNKQARHNRLVSYLILSNEDNAFSIAELYNRLIADGFDVTRKTVDRDIAQLSLEHAGLLEIEVGLHVFTSRKAIRCTTPSALKKIIFKQLSSPFKI
jgi:arginine repressor